MYSDAPPSSHQGRPIKVMGRGGGFQIPIYRDNRGFHARHGYIPNKRWQKFKRSLPELERICEQEIAQLRQGDFHRNRFTQEHLDALAYAIRTIGETSLVTVIDQWRKWKPVFEHKWISIDGAVKEYLERMKDDWSPRTFGARRGYLEGFVRMFPGKALSDVYTKENLLRFASSLRGKKAPSGVTGAPQAASSWTRKDNKRTHRAFFIWAQGNNYLPKEFQDPTVHLPVGRTLSQHRYMTPEQKDDLILRAPFELLPMLLIRLFTGIRPEEGRPSKIPKHSEVHGFSYTWENISIEDKNLTAYSGETKLRKPKVVQLDGVLLEIFEFYKSIPGITGLIDPPDAQRLLVDQAYKPFGEKWIPNAIRHSVATMRLQRKDPIVDVLSEMQTSIAMINKHYFEMSKVKPKDHLKWFSLNVPSGHRWQRVKKSSGFRPAWWNLITDDVVDAFCELMQSLTKKYQFRPLQNETNR